MIKHFCDICGGECSDPEKVILKSSYGATANADLCYTCYKELREYYRNMLRRNPNSYIHEADKLIKEAEVKYDTSIS